MRTALEPLGLTDLDCTPAAGGGTCTFKAPKEMDVEAKLDEIATKGNKLEGWTRN